MGFVYWTRAVNSTGPRRTTEPFGTGAQTPGESRLLLTKVPLLLCSSRTIS